MVFASPRNIYVIALACNIFGAFLIAFTNLFRIGWSFTCSIRNIRGKKTLVVVKITSVKLVHFFIFVLSNPSTR